MNISKSHEEGSEETQMKFSLLRNLVEKLVKNYRYLCNEMIKRKMIIIIILGKRSKKEGLMKFIISSSSFHDKLIEIGEKGFRQASLPFVRFFYEILLVSWHG